jgi:maleylpyruvate isomerase
MVTVPVPAREIAGCRSAHATLDRALGLLSGAQARRPSLLPGWTVGHVLTHLARNADSTVRRLEAASVGEVVDQYRGGYEGRSAEIEDGARRPAEELVADVRSSSARVQAAFDRYPDDAWGRPTRSVSGEVSPAAAMVLSRWREVELHHVDLGIGYRPSDWPAESVEAFLPEVLAGLRSRTDPALLLAWATGRGSPPVLDAWR